MLIIQVAAVAQNNTVNYTYDASGNRITRRVITVQKVAPLKNNPDDTVTTIVADINGIIAEDNSSQALSEGEGESGSNPNGIVSLSEGDIKVFPNPVQDKLNVQFNGTAKANGCSLQLYDGAAKLFYKNDAMQTLTKVNMQQAKAGIYYLVVVCKDGKRLYWKVMKE